VRTIKLLLVSPCFGTYGGIEAFVLAVADAVRQEPDFVVRLCFKKVKGFALHPGLAAMLRQESVLFVDRAGGDLADRKSTRLNSSHSRKSRMPSSA